MRYDQFPHHEHPLRRGRAAMSRRAFLARASAFTVGTVATTGLLRTAASAASPGAEGATDSGHSPGIGLAVPIPYGNDFLGNGTIFHAEAPGFPGFGEDPSTVYNFAGVSAVGYIDGTVVRRNRRTSEEVTLPFIASDMRFMQGQFEGADGRVRQATFGFV